MQRSGWWAHHRRVHVKYAGRRALRTPEGERDRTEGDVVAFLCGDAGLHQVSYAPIRVLMLPALIVRYPDSGKFGAEREGRTRPSQPAWADAGLLGRPGLAQTPLEVLRDLCFCVDSSASGVQSQSVELDDKQRSRHRRRRYCVGTGADVSVTARWIDWSNSRAAASLANRRERWRPSASRERTSQRPLASPQLIA
jgi:hypothetical protein